MNQRGIGCQSISTPEKKADDRGIRCGYKSKTKKKEIAVDSDVDLNPRRMKQKNWTHFDRLMAISLSVLRLKNKKIKKW